MISKFLMTAIVLSMALLESCDTNPVPWDYTTAPKSVKTYTTHDLRSMVQDSMGDYWAITYSYLYRIKPGSPDTAGSIVSAVASPASVYLNGYSRLFRDSAGHCFLHTTDHICRLYENDSVAPVLSTDYSWGQWPQLTSVDASGRCRYLTSAGNAFNVKEFDGRTEKTVLADSIAPGYPTLTQVRFCSNGGWTVLVYTTAGDKATHLRLYENDVVREDTLLWHVDSCTVNAVALIDSCAYLAVLPAYRIVVGSRYGGFDYIPAHTQAVLCKMPGRRPYVAGTSDPQTSLALQYEATCRSTGEVWFYGNDGYVRVTPERVEWTAFRNSWFNNYDVFCFNRDGDAVFFDEATQDFAVMR